MTTSFTRGMPSRETGLRKLVRRRAKDRNAAQCSGLMPDSDPLEWLRYMDHSPLAQSQSPPAAPARSPPIPGRGLAGPGLFHRADAFYFCIIPLAIRSPRVLSTLCQYSRARFNTGLETPHPRGVHPLFDGKPRLQLPMARQHLIRASKSPFLWGGYLCLPIVRRQALSRRYRQAHAERVHEFPNRFIARLCPRSERLVQTLAT